MPPARLSRLLLPALAVIATALAAAAVPSARPAAGPADRQTSQPRTATGVRGTVARGTGVQGTAAATEPAIFRDPARTYLATVSDGGTARIEAALRRELRARPRLLARLGRREMRRISLEVPAAPGRAQRVRLHVVRLTTSRTVATRVVTTYRVTTRGGRTARLVVVSADHLTGARPMAVTTYPLRCLARPVILLLTGQAKRALRPGAENGLRHSLTVAACGRPGGWHAHRYRG